MPRIRRHIIFPLLLYCVFGLFTCSVQAEDTFQLRIQGFGFFNVYIDGSFILSGNDYTVIYTQEDVPKSSKVIAVSGANVGENGGIAIDGKYIYTKVGFFGWKCASIEQLERQIPNPLNYISWAQIDFDDSDWWDASEGYQPHDLVIRNNGTTIWEKVRAPTTFCRGYIGNTFEVRVQVGNEFRLYVDGSFVGSGNKPQVYSYTGIPTTSKIIGIRGTNLGANKGIALDSDHIYTHVDHFKWKCISYSDIPTVPNPDSDPTWAGVDFDDSDWPDALPGSLSHGLHVRNGGTSIWAEADAVSSFCRGHIGGTFDVRIQVDDEFDLYIDGTHSVSGNDDKTMYTQGGIPVTASLLAVRGTSNRASGGIALASSYIFTKPGRFGWKCIDHSQLFIGEEFPSTDLSWTTTGYNDSWWPDALQGSIPHSLRNIGKGGTSIWASSEAINVYCRGYIDECRGSPCLHGGVCSDGVGEFTCDCTGTGYYGDRCEHDPQTIDLSVQCDDECTVYVDGVNTTSATNYKHIVTYYNEIPTTSKLITVQASNSLGGAGIAIDSAHIYTKVGRFGWKCTTDTFNNDSWIMEDFDDTNWSEPTALFDCWLLNSPCLKIRNRGTTIWASEDKLGTVSCRGYLDECRSSPCINGGTCIDGSDSFTCNCDKTGHTGEICETDVDECSLTSPVCSNNGACFNTIGSFFCDCSNTGYRGVTCQQGVSSTRSSSTISTAVFGCLCGLLVLAVVALVIVNCKLKANLRSLKSSSVYCQLSISANKNLERSTPYAEISRDSTRGSYTDISVINTGSKEATQSERTVGQYQNVGYIKNGQEERHE